MQRGFNPLADIAAFLGSIASALPPLPLPPSPQPPEVSKPRTETPSNSISYVDVNDGLLKASTERFRAEQKAKGLVPFYYE